MSLSFSCPSCGKHFRKIKSEMAGKKARCSCGTIVRLGPRQKTSRDEQRPGPQKRSSKRESSDLKKADLLDVDLLGEEMLGESLASSDRLEGQPKVVQPKVVQPKVVQPKKIESVPVPREGESNQVQAELPKPQPVKQKRKPPKPKQARKSEPRAVVPRADAVVSVANFEDLDDILAGAGDTAPIVARPPGRERQDERQRDQLSGNAGSGTEGDLRQHPTSRLGFAAALISATLAFWFGLLVAVSRFQIFDWILLNGFSQQLQLVNEGTFGHADIPGTYRIMFVTLGWLLWTVAIALILIGVAQFVNAVIKLFVGRQPLKWLRWADGLTGALGVSALFLMVSMVFAQATFANYQNRLLDEFETPIVAEGEQLENVFRLREGINDRSRLFTLVMLTGASVPMTVFALSMVRLFTKTADRAYVVA